MSRRDAEPFVLMSATEREHYAQAVDRMADCAERNPRVRDHLRKAAAQARNEQQGGFYEGTNWS